jgi:hypothetical protein
MLGFLNSVVDVVELADGRMVFRSSRKFAEGKRFSVKAALQPGSSQLSTLDVEILTGRPAEQGGILYVGFVHSQVAGVEVHNDSAAAAVRRASRYALGARVMSRHLPGYRGSTIDMSRTGLQLESDGPIELHQVLELNMDFDRVDLPNLTCHAEVTWCRPAAGSDRYRVGLQFTPTSLTEQQRIDAVANFFEQRSHTDLHTLLEEAKLMPSSMVAAPVPAPAPASEAPAPRRRGYRLPLEAVVQGYLYDHQGRNVTLVVRGVDGIDHRLEFPECQTLLDHACCQGETARFLEVLPDSDLLHQAMQRHPGPWKHYRVIESQGEPFVELISGQMEMPS